MCLIQILLSFIFAISLQPFSINLLEEKERDLFSGFRNIQKEMINHFSSTFSICLVTTGLRSRILISSWPPTARRPSISGNVSWSTHCDSSGCSLTPIDPTHTSLRKKPTLFQTSTLALDLLNTRWQLLSLIFKGILMLKLYSGLLESLITPVFSLKGVSLG